MNATTSTHPTPRKTPLIIVSSKTGNTMLLARGIEDAFPETRLVRADALPADLTPFNPVILGFWCDRGMAPEDIQAAARRLADKDLGCFATMGGDPAAPKSLEWMEKTSKALAAEGEGNTLRKTFLCRGRIDPALFERMTAMMGGEVTPEREARRKASEAHPDRMDVVAGVEAFAELLGAGREPSAAAF